MCEHVAAKVDIGGRTAESLRTRNPTTRRSRRRPRSSAAPATRPGVAGLMRELANELGPYSIRVNTVKPALAATDVVQNDTIYKLFPPGVVESESGGVHGAADGAE